MKGSCTLVASVLAASTIALSTSSASASTSTSCNEDGSRIRRSKTKMSTEKEKFAPRLDGLRFIETLVTAHR